MEKSDWVYRVEQEAIGCVNEKLGLYVSYGNPTRHEKPFLAANNLRFVKIGEEEYKLREFHRLHDSQKEAFLVAHLLGGHDE